MDHINNSSIGPTKNPIGFNNQDNDIEKSVEPSIDNTIGGRSEKNNKKLRNIFYCLRPCLKRISPYFQWPTLPPIVLSYLQPLDGYFLIEEAGSTIETEIHAGIINFLSGLYIIPVISKILGGGGYQENFTASTCSLMMGVGTILMGIITNTPLIVVPTPGN